MLLNGTAEKGVPTSTEPTTCVPALDIESSGARSEPHTEIMEKLFVLSDIIYQPELWALKLESCSILTEPDPPTDMKTFEVDECDA